MLLVWRIKWSSKFGQKISRVGQMTTTRARVSQQNLCIRFDSAWFRLFAEKCFPSSYLVAVRPHWSREDVFSCTSNNSFKLIWVGKTYTYYDLRPICFCYIVHHLEVFIPEILLNGRAKLFSNYRYCTSAKS